MKYKDTTFHVDWSLEIGLIHFISGFKSNILSDPRIMLLGAAAKADVLGKKQKEAGLDRNGNPNEYNSDDDMGNHYPYSRASGSSPSTDSTDIYSSYNSIAQIMEKKDMKTILNAFAEKILLNLAYTKPQGSSKKKNEMSSMNAINLSLDVLAIYTGSAQGCRLLGNTDIMK